MVPEQPGLKHDFLREMVRLGHHENFLVLGYFCAGSNTKWGLDRPDLSYGTPTAPHIPYTDEYLAYLEAAVADAVGAIGIDGFMVDWVRMPLARGSTGGRWLVNIELGDANLHMANLCFITSPICLLCPNAFPTRPT